MLRLVALIFCLAGLVGAAMAAPDRAPRPLASALHASQRGDWDRAAELAARDGPAAVSLIEWYRLRAGRGTPQQVLAFLDGHAHWPGHDLLRKRSEAAFETAPHEQVLAFFDGHPPQTGRGVLRHARALAATGALGDAEVGLVLAWRSFHLGADEHADFLAAHADLLAPHHEARLDMALWRGLESDVRLMLPLVDDGWRALAAARQGLRAGAGDVDTLIEAVPEALQDDPGLAYERFLWRLGKGLRDEAIALLLDRSTTATLGEPGRWAGWRRNLARGEMRAGRADLAYRIATNHGLVEGASFADLEWLAGYVALTQLDDPARALAHFRAFTGAVDTPISLGRAGYWLGRAYAALGDAATAQVAYAEGARYQTSFYGLLAAEQAGIAPPVELGGAEYFPAWQQADFADSDLVKVVELALAMGNLTLAEWFVLQLAEDQNRRVIGQIGNMIEDLAATYPDAAHLAVMLGKSAARRGIVLPGPYYALHPMKDMVHTVPVELALAIARRESEFDPSVASGVGAQGLMQLMPATAKEVARDLGLDHDPAQVIADWRYNATLGSAYLAGLARRFDGNVVMVSAGYNAGPGRPIRWMQERGDPRKGEIDVIDWIEHIPFRETRNYVMRVAESLPVYRARLGLDPLPEPFSRELTGSSVLPLPPQGE
ncbi:lytic transglycosylase domain-containing protein [Aquicoccus porphyridii]|uniref:lytic transglycosylase domain-containing protein n=1 Tax=Aquicoccus porphyridii TaxID=1852029 RepID=UPI00273DD2B2|nr:lytic transglycosylase domain-containing protein [Aquicoccus porphyridii]